MKKLKTLFHSLSVTLILIFVFFLMSGITQPINTNEIDYLNYELNTLKEKLETLENQLQTIHESNNELYSQLLGVNYDTTNFFKYKNDTAKIVFSKYKNVFSTLDDKMIYVSEKLASELKKVEETSKLFKTNKNAINYYPNISPIKTKDFIELSSPYGWRKHPIFNKYLFHNGVDISANPGTNVYATAQGRVVYILYSKYGYGNRVVIKHAYGFKTLYAHLSIIYVKKGQWIKKNQIIGLVGNTGLSTAPHLHYEIIKNDEYRDPLGYFYTNITDELLTITNNDIPFIDRNKYLSIK